MDQKPIDSLPFEVYDSILSFLTVKENFTFLLLDKCRNRLLLQASHNYILTQIYLKESPWRSVCKLFWRDKVYIPKFLVALTQEGNSVAVKLTQYAAQHDPSLQVRKDLVNLPAKDIKRRLKQAGYEKVV